MDRTALVAYNVQLITVSIRLATCSRYVEIGRRLCWGATTTVCVISMSETANISWWIINKYQYPRICDADFKWFLFQSLIMSWSQLVLFWFHWHIPIILIFGGWIELLANKYLHINTSMKDVSHMTPEPTLNEEKIEQVDSFNFLGVVIDKHISWKYHTEMLSNKISKYCGVLSRLKNYLPLFILRTLYFSMVH